MSNNSLSKLCNLLKTNDKNKLSIVKIKFSKMCIKVVSVLLKEGFIRGFYVSTYNNEKILFVLLKHTEDNSLFKFKNISAVEYRCYLTNLDIRKRSKSFDFFILSTKKGVMSNLEAVRLNIGGFPLINVI